MNAAERQVALQIEEAFRGVVLGNGIGLKEAQGLDDYADEATLVEYRSRDEKLDWAAIPAVDLNQCYSSLSFFDAEGMRFHLPAFLIAESNGLFKQDVIFTLTCFDFGNLSRFSHLSREQRAAVRQFLLLPKSSPGREFVQPMIDQALAGYWIEANDV